jgi:8-amino-7-oxononanoate synthase
VDLFQKCRSFTRADEIKAAGFYPYFRPIEENEGPVVTIEGRKVIMAGSNNYHGLTADPRVKEAAIKAVEKYGTGCSGSRYPTGNADLHIQLEKIRRMFGRERCLLFSTGWSDSAGHHPTLVQKEYVVSRTTTASSPQIHGQGSSRQFVRFKHNDMDDLSVVSKLPRWRKTIVSTAPSHDGRMRCPKIVKSRATSTHASHPMMRDRVIGKGAGAAVPGLEGSG